MGQLQNHLLLGAEDSLVGAAGSTADPLLLWRREPWASSHPALGNDVFSSSPQRTSPPSPPTAPAGREVAVVAVCEQESSSC